MRHTRERTNVVIVPGRDESINAYENVARVDAVKPPHEIFTRASFGVRRDRIFQIYNDAVGTGRKRLANLSGRSPGTNRKLRSAAISNSFRRGAAPIAQKRLRIAKALGRVGRERDFD